MDFICPDCNKPYPATREAFVGPYCVCPRPQLTTTSTSATPAVFRQDAIDDMNRVAAAVSGEPEIQRLRDIITVHADLFAERAARCRATEKRETGASQAFWLGRAEVYELVAFTLRAQLKA